MNMPRLKYKNWAIYKNVLCPLINSIVAENKLDLNPLSSHLSPLFKTNPPYASIVTRGGKRVDKGVSKCVRIENENFLFEWCLD